MSDDSNQDKPVPTFDAAYHARQWETCYDNTQAFFAFLAQQGALKANSNDNIVDLGCGSGANLYWLKQAHPGVTLTGIEIDPDLVAFANDELTARDIPDTRVVVGDVYDLDSAAAPAPDGVISIQTISWLPDEVGFVEAAAALSPEWIAVTGLMIDGSHTFRTEISDHGNPNKGINFYNTFSIDYLRQLFGDAGYPDVVVAPFEIGIDLAKPDGGKLGTYTEKTDDGRRLQISGALMMSWHFLIARRAAV